MAFGSVSHGRSSSGGDHDRESCSQSMTWSDPPYVFQERPVPERLCGPEEGYIEPGGKHSPGPAAGMTAAEDGTYAVSERSRGIVTDRDPSSWPVLARLGRTFVQESATRRYCCCRTPELAGLASSPIEVVLTVVVSAVGHPGAERADVLGAAAAADAAADAADIAEMGPGYR